EDMASGWGISRGYLVESILRTLVEEQSDRITAQDVGQSAGQGDPLSLEVLNRAWTCLAECICHVIALLCPRRIVIGGGVSLMGERVLFEPLRKLVADRVFKPFAGSYEIVPAALGEEVVVHGALALAHRRLR